MKFYIIYSQLFIVFVLDQKDVQGGAVSSTVVAQQKRPRFETGLGPFCVVFARSLLVPSEHSDFLLQSKVMQGFRLIGGSKLIIDVEVEENGLLTDVFSI